MSHRIEEEGYITFIIKKPDGSEEEKTLDVWKTQNDIYNFQQRYLNAEEELQDYNGYHEALRQYFKAIGFPDGSDWYFAQVAKKVRDHTEDLKKKASTEENANLQSSTESTPSS